jgi:hypothetical protein
VIVLLGNVRAIHGVNVLIAQLDNTRVLIHILLQVVLVAHQDNLAPVQVQDPVRLVRAEGLILELALSPVLGVIMVNMSPAIIVHVSTVLRVSTTQILAVRLEVLIVKIAKQDSTTQEVVKPAVMHARVGELAMLVPLPVPLVVPVNTRVVVILVVIVLQEKNQMQVRHPVPTVKVENFRRKVHHHALNANRVRLTKVRGQHVKIALQDGNPLPQKQVAITVPRVSIKRVRDRVIVTIVV